MKKKGAIVCLSTSGTRLDGSTGAEMIASGLDYLIVAFDGATPRTYEKYRKGASFHQVKDNVERFLALKTSTQSRIHVTLQMILLNGTRKEVSAFKQLWTRPGVDQVRLREDLLKRPSMAKAARSCDGHRPCFFLWRGPLFVQAAGTVIPCPY
jgi:MoaA/NifB/PqqE/SkfB family radical SAM enzyme